MAYLTDVTQLPQLAAEMEGHYSARNELMRRMRLTYFMRPEVAKPANTPWYQVPSAHNSVNMFVEMLAASFPTMRVPKQGPGRINETKSAQVERFIQGVWQRSERRTRSPLLRYLYWQAGVYGWMTTKVLYDPSEWGPYPQQRDWEDEGRYNVRLAEHYLRRPEAMPIKIQVRNPSTIYPQPTGDDGYEYVIEVYNRRVADVRHRWGANLMPNRQESEIVQWVEYWDSENLAYMCDGQVVTDLTPHGYGFPPYIVGRSFPLPEEDPELQGISLLFAISDLVDYESRLFSQKASAVEKYAWPVLLARWNQMNANGQPIPIDLRPGSINYLQEGESVEYLEWKGSMPAIDEQEATVRGHIDRSTFPAIMYGQGIRANQSGRLIQQATNAPRLKIASAKNQLQWLLEDTNECVLKLVEAMGEGVSIWHKGKGNAREKVTIYPDDIGGYYANDVDIRPQLPEDELEKAAVGERLVAARIISRERARDKYAAVEDPVEEADQILMEEVMDMPLYKLWIALKIAEKHSEDLGPLLRQQIKSALANAYQQAMTGGGGGMGGGQQALPGGPQPQSPMAPAAQGVRVAQGQRPAPRQPGTGGPAGAPGRIRVAPTQPTAPVRAPGVAQPSVGAPTLPTPIGG